MWLPRVTPICCTGSRLRKTRRVSRGKPFWACDILGPAKSGEREGGLLGGGGRGQQISWHLTARAKEKAAHGHVAYAVQEVSKTASKGAQNGTLCPRNERCAVEDALPVTVRIPHDLAVASQFGNQDRNLGVGSQPRSQASFIFFVLFCSLCQPGPR
jgi:hypothetical protein